MTYAPFRVCCGGQHFGPVCSDGKVMCCLCFERVDQAELATEDGQKTDVCQSCYERDRSSVETLTAKQWLNTRADHYDAEARMLRDIGEARMGLIFEIIRDELRKCVGEMEA